MNVYLPARWEFGWIVMAHAPQVYADDGEKVVICEPSLEALYPGACGYVHCDVLDDDHRRSHVEHEYMRELTGRLKRSYPEAKFVQPDKNAARRYFIPMPYQRQGVGEYDVVVCPRKRQYGSDKNWPWWSVITNGLRDAGCSVFAAGARHASYRVNCECAWDYERCLDATIEAMLRCKVVVATDSGLAHLAVMCGRPLILISHRDGLVAPGHDDCGRPYWPIHMDRFKQENHTDSPIYLLKDAWNDYDMVMERAMSFLNMERIAS